jgi:hypothetical protein
MVADDMRGRLTFGAGPGFGRCGTVMMEAPALCSRENALKLLNW